MGDRCHIYILMGEVLPDAKNDHDAVQTSGRGIAARPRYQHERDGTSSRRSLRQRGGALGEELDEVYEQAYTQQVFEEACTQQVGSGELSEDEPEDAFTTARIVPLRGDELVVEEAIELPSIPGAVFGIGRTAACGLKLIDTDAAQPCVHREHAEIRVGEAGELTLTLVGKGQCTFVNGTALYHIALPWQTYEQQPVHLADGDELRFGGNVGQGYSKFVYKLLAPGVARPDRDAHPLVAAPALLPKPAKGAAPRVRATAQASVPAPPLAHATLKSASAPMLARLVAINGTTTLQLDATPRAKTLLFDGAAIVIATRVGGFDLHVKRPCVGYARAKAAAAATLKAGDQRALHHGDRVTLDAGNTVVEFICELPQERAQAAASAASSSTAASFATATPSAVAALAADSSGAASETPDELAARLAVIAQEEGLIRSKLTSGLTGREQREAQRSLSAAHDALVGVALSAAAGTSAEHAARVASNQLKKVADDADRKRRHEEAAHAAASAKAQRREDHAPPAPPQPRPDVVRAPGGRPAKRDRRTYENRTVARKRRRLAQDERRHVEIVHDDGGSGGNDEGSGDGGGSSGGSGGGKGYCSKGYGGKGSGAKGHGDKSYGSGRGYSCDKGHGGGKGYGGSKGYSGDRGDSGNGKSGKGKGGRGKGKGKGGGGKGKGGRGRGKGGRSF